MLNTRHLCERSGIWSFVKWLLLPLLPHPRLALLPPSKPPESCCSTLRLLPPLLRPLSNPLTHCEPALACPLPLLHRSTLRLLPPLLWPLSNPLTRCKPALVFPLPLLHPTLPARPPHTLTPPTLSPPSFSAGSFNASTPFSNSWIPSSPAPLKVCCFFLGATQHKMR